MNTEFERKWEASMQAEALNKGDKDKGWYVIQKVTYEVVHD